CGRFPHLLADRHLLRPYHGVRVLKGRMQTMIHEILAFIQNLLHQFDVWIYNSPPPGVIRDSKYAIPIIQTFHLVGITTILGTTVVTNLRLLNIGYREIPLDVIVAQLRRWFKIGLITT